MLNVLFEQVNCHSPTQPQLQLGLIRLNILNLSCQGLSSFEHYLIALKEHTL
jgi:hypothetical protein